MAYIQILPVDGTGEKIYPDAAMDAGTRGLIDTIDPWSWGGTTPAQGAALALGAGPRNYPLAEDGWIEDAAAAGVAGLTYNRGAVRFAAANDYLRLPRGFKIVPADTHFGHIFWLQNAMFPGQADNANNNILADISGGNSKNLALSMTYASGAITSCRIESRRHNNLAVPTAWRTALFDGALHQFGLEVTVSADATTITYGFYLDGALIGTLTANITNPYIAAGETDYVCFGRHHINVGSGIYGRLWRAIFEDLTISGARPMSETVALDHSLNRARIAALAAVAP